MPSLTEENRAHFNAAAASYNAKYEKTIEQITQEIIARRDWIGVKWAESQSSDENQEFPSSSSNHAPRNVRLLDYACGTGLVSRALAPYVTQCVGIDLAENMVDEYNTRVSNQGIPASEMCAHVGNLLAESPSSASLPGAAAAADAPPPLSGPEFSNFDIAVVGFAFHHFDDPPRAAARLAERLKPGGVLLIVDFLPHAHHNHHHHHAAAAAKTVTHMGFGEEDIRGMFAAAGVGEGFDFVVVGKGVVFNSESGEEMKRTVFMAKGVKE